MNFLDQGTDQGLPIECHSVSGFDLSNDFGDMERAFGPSEYVYCPVNIRHTSAFLGFALFGLRGF